MKKLFIPLVFLFVQINAQNLYYILGNYSNSVIYDYIFKINNSDSEVISSTNLYSTSASNTGSMAFDSIENKIFAYNGGMNVIIKHDLSNSQNSILQLPNAGSTNEYFSQIVIADGRLFLCKSNLTNVTSIVEFNKTTGEIIDEHSFTNIPIEYLKNVCFSSETSEIILLSNNKITRHNIITGVDTVVDLPNSSSTTIYDNVEVINQKLYVTKRIATNGTTNFFIDVYEISNGNLLNSYPLTNDFSNVEGGITNLCYLASTNELCGIVKYPSQNQLGIFKFNIISLAENINFKWFGSTDFFGDLVSTSLSSNTLSANGNSISTSNKKIKNAYNLSGQKVPVDTKNEIIVIEFENGERKKVLQR